MNADILRVAQGGHDVSEASASLFVADVCSLLAAHCTVFDNSNGKARTWF
ncbi:MAG: hypothetical protein MUC92_06265 [Fimbriimonadaceae bacterium]|nr:hypothetical protein [Fimbriimonadaceae bacterium]